MHGRNMNKSSHSGLVLQASDGKGWMAFAFLCPSPKPFFLLTVSQSIFAILTQLPCLLSRITLNPTEQHPEDTHGYCHSAHGYQANTLTDQKASLNLFAIRREIWTEGRGGNRPMDWETPHWEHQLLIHKIILKKIKYFKVLGAH